VKFIAQILVKVINKSSYPKNMPHSVKEEHLEDICANCKKPHGNSIILENFNHKIYEIITCQNCGYEIFRLRQEKTFTDKWDMFHRV
jgi:hypothetical protein